MDEVTKYTKLWALPQGYGNPWGKNDYWKDISQLIAEQLWEMGFTEYHTILDIGGGNGSMKPFMPTCKEYVTLDIAPNSGADIICDISDEDCLSAEAFIEPFSWSLAIDMLEHLPTIRVDQALRNIWTVTEYGFIALISTRPDRGGKKIGATLHMTVREPMWWVGMLAKYWRNIKLPRVVGGEYCIVICTP